MSMSSKEGMSSFCIICCNSFILSSSDNDNPEFETYQRANFKKFCKEVLDSHQDQFKLEESPSSKSLPVCRECLSIISTVVNKKEETDKIEKNVRELQLQILKELRILQNVLNDYREEIEKIQEIVKDSNVLSLESYMDRRQEKESKLGSEKRKAAVADFRRNILTASQQFQAVEVQLQEKLLQSSPPPPTVQKLKAEGNVNEDKSPVLKKRSRKEKLKPSKEDKYFTPHLKNDHIKTEHQTADASSSTSKRRKRSSVRPVNYDEYDEDEEPLLVVKKEENLSDLEDSFVGEDTIAVDPLFDLNFGVGGYDGDHQHNMIANDSDYDPDGEDDDASDGDADNLSNNESASEDENGEINRKRKLKPSLLRTVKNRIKKKSPLPSSSSSHPLPKSSPSEIKRYPPLNYKRLVPAGLVMSKFRTYIVKRVLIQQERRRRREKKKLNEAQVQADEDEIEDPSENYACNYDFTSGELTLETVKILLDDEKRTLTCSICSHTVKHYWTEKQQQRKEEEELKEGKSSSLKEEKHSKRGSPTFQRMFLHILGRHLEAFKCPICSVVKSGRKFYKDHMREHKNPAICREREAKRKEKRSLNPAPRCPICSRSFHAKHQLKSHMETHLDRSERNLIMCPQCGKSLTKGGWVSHQANSCRAEGAPEFRCEECPPERRNTKVFKSEALYKRHLKRCHSSLVEDKPILCTICGKSFKLMQDLKSHMRCHSDARPFVCVYGCGASYKTTNHRKRHHEICKMRSQK